MNKEPYSEVRFILQAIFVCSLVWMLFVFACNFGPHMIEDGLKRTGTASYLWRFLDHIQLDAELQTRAEKAEAEMEELRAKMEELRSQKNPSWPRSDGPYYFQNPWVMTNFYYVTNAFLDVSAGQ